MGGEPILPVTYITELWVSFLEKEAPIHCLGLGIIKFYFSFNRFSALLCIMAWYMGSSRFRLFINLM